ncbi:LPXTG cell wall anchor domain-containing protein [Streptomyces sp. NPDC052225]
MASPATGQETPMKLLIILAVIVIAAIWFSKARRDR